MTYIPVTGGPSNGWYTVADSTSAVSVDSTATTFTAADWTGSYTTYNDTICTNSAQVTSAISSCVSDLTFAAVSSLSAGDTTDYKGILGLGKVSGTNTNWVYEWALENHQTPLAFL